MVEVYRLADTPDYSYSIGHFAMNDTTRRCSFCRKELNSEDLLIEIHERITRESDPKTPYAPFYEDLKNPHIPKDWNGEHIPSGKCHHQCFPNSNFLQKALQENRKGKEIIAMIL